MTITDAQFLETLREHLQPLTGRIDDYDRIMDFIGGALPGSYETACHDADVPRFLLAWRETDALYEPLCEPRLDRAIGVIYRPDTERASHYFYARLARQFDAVLHFDETRAVEPLDAVPEWEAGAGDISVCRVRRKQFVVRQT
jgi:erythromycin esterase